MSFARHFYPETQFGGFTDIDGTIAFYLRVQALMRPEHVVLDVGCGRGAHQDDDVGVRRDLRVFKGKVAEVVGLDVDPGAAGNPYVDRFHLLDGPRWPIDDASVDLMVSDMVVEHLEDPEQFFSEARRVLKPGGHICLRTPNAISYVALVSMLVPNRHHSKVIEKVQDGRLAEDVFPTYYRCNTVSALKKMLRRKGFDQMAVYGYEAEPGYFAFSKIAYAVGVLHQRLMPKAVSPTLFAFGRLAD